MHRFVSLVPYLSLILALIRFILDEYRYRQKVKREKVDRYHHELSSHEKGVYPYPPRKDKHQKR
ncbi:hypothetical protein [Paenibacillus odorifer]|uniref:hypothetical protein n=1 Tax=Paenibacillus odorifer TaxID=189426 RepID=UPI00096DAF6B|nr:hypothetical protein [Paenibacillus odorifer]OMD09834.1 hypothetical protein BJP50_29315 [Paenibacillus odorifer]